MTDQPWLAHYDAGVPHAIDIPPIALPELLAAAQDFPAAPAILFYRTTISYAELDARHGAARLRLCALRWRRASGWFWCCRIRLRRSSASVARCATVPRWCSLPW